MRSGAPSPSSASWLTGGTGSALSDSDFDFLRGLIERESAMIVGDDRRHYIETRLWVVAQKHGMKVRDLVTAARRREAAFVTQIVEAATIHESSFFRDVRAFELIRRRLLPRLIEARQSRRALTIWSAACALGQEPYSIAMLVLEHFPELADWDVRILATDISAQALEVARQGSYSQFEVNRGVPGAYLPKYFVRQGVRWAVNASVRQLVEFRQIKLQEPWDDLRPDLVLMRNVLIYFDQDTKRSILECVRQSVPSDGLLLLGAPETAWGVCDSWDCVREDGATYFQTSQNAKSERRAK